MLHNVCENDALGMFQSKSRVHYATFKERMSKRLPIHWSRATFMTLECKKSHTYRPKKPISTKWATCQTHVHNKLLTYHFEMPVSRISRQFLRQICLESCHMIFFFSLMSEFWDMTEFKIAYLSFHGASFVKNGRLLCKECIDDCPQLYFQRSVCNLWGTTIFPTFSMRFVRHTWAKNCIFYHKESISWKKFTSSGTQVQRRQHVEHKCWKTCLPSTTRGQFTPQLGNF